MIIKDFFKALSRPAGPRLRRLALELSGLCAACAGAAGPVMVQAQETWPQRQVRIIVPVLPGGASDTLTRAVAEKLSEALGKPFVVENRAGADNAIGLNLVARAVPDGHTLGLGSAAMTIHQALGVKKRPYDALRDFSPIALLGSSTTLLAARNNFPASNLRELIDYARAHPGKVSYGSCGNGSVQHIAGELLIQMAKIELLHVPYKGCAEGIPQLLNGDVDFLINTVANLQQYVRSGRIKPWATTGERRAQTAPELPTIAEAGFPGYNLNNWFGIIAPSGVPTPILDRLNAEINRALTRSEVRERLTGLKLDVHGGSREEFAAMMKSETERFARALGSLRLGAD